jgi:hypothetical protein
MAGCVNLKLKSVDHPLSPCVMMAPRAQSRRHLRVAFGFLGLDDFLQTTITDILMPAPMAEHSGGTDLATMRLQK